MRRIYCLILFGMFARYAVASGDPVAPRSCVPAVSDLSTPPADQYSVLRIDTELKLLTLNAVKQPKAGLQMTRSIAAEIHSLPNQQLRSLLDGRLAPIYIKLDRPEAVGWLAAIPSRKAERSYYDYKALAYSAVISAVQDSPKFQMELLDRGLSSGAFQITQMPPLLQRLKGQSPSDASALFRQAIVAFPANRPTDQDVRFLFQLTRIMMDSSKDDAATAVKLMMAALNNPDLQAPPIVMPLFLPVSQSVGDRNAALRAEVKRLAVTLQVDDGDSGASTSDQQAPVSNRRPNRKSGAMPTSPLSGGISTDSSAEFKNAVNSLQGDVSEDDIVPLANTIPNKEERTQFYALVVRKLKNRPVSIAHLAAAILSEIDGNDDPELSLGVPRMVFHSALQASDAAKAQLALATFTHEVANTCGNSHLSEGDAGFVKGSACIQEYGQMAVEIAKSPIRGRLQVTDPSLIERLKLADSQNCGASAHTGKPAS